MNVPNNPVCQHLSERFGIRKGFGPLTAHIGVCLPEVVDIKDLDEARRFFSDRSNALVLQKYRLAKVANRSLSSASYHHAVSPTGRRNICERNARIHTSPATLLNYLVRALVDESETDCVLDRGGLSEHPSDEFFYVRNVPLEISRLAHESVGKIIPLPDDFSERKKPERENYILFHLAEILGQLSAATLAQRTRDAHTARIFSFQSTDGHSRIGIMRTRDTERGSKSKKKYRMKRSSLAIFSDTETATRSQMHAIESLSDKRKILGEIRAHLIEIVRNSPNLSVQRETEIMRNVLDCLDEKDGYYIQRIRRNITSSLAVLERGRRIRGNFAFENVLVNLDDLIVELIAKEKELSGTLDMITGLDQFASG